MSIKKLFEKNRQAITVSKYLKKTNPDDLGDGIESHIHLSASITKRNAYTPPVDYGDPKNFAHYGSAAKYYENAFNYIRDYYPYDGSGFEKTKFFNDLNPLEKYVLDEKYPHATGYIVNGSPYGSIASNSTGYYSSSHQYVHIQGGPHSGTIYSTGSYRTNNLEFGGVSGSTVEFFLKKDSPTISANNSKNQVILDVWNGAPSSSANYGRLRIEMRSGSSAADTDDRFYVTMMSGIYGFVTASVPFAGGLTISDGTWRNYGFVFNTDLKSPTIDFYVDGKCIETGITGSSGQISGVTAVSSALGLAANLGALRTWPSGVISATPYEGYGKLSASLDEFRFWKTKRTAEEIGRNWFTNINGGADKYDSNLTLGVYYPFNEGITGITNVDKIVLDYSGRLSNGNYVGYTSDSRNSGSAINSLNLESVLERGDPIVRSGSSVLYDRKTEMISSGTQYDYTNTANLMNTLPGWIYEEDESAQGELRSITQIMGSYLDTLHVQISELAKLKQNRYLSGSITGSLNEFPYNDRLLDSYGLQTPEIFENIGALGQLLQRDEAINFDQELVSIKNALYRNVYNNLSLIFKAKGNPKSIRNLIRCYGIGENILSLNAYADNETYKLRTNYNPGVSTKKYVDFSGLTDRSSPEAVVYQYYDSSNPNSYGLISPAAAVTASAYTIEFEGYFPSRQNSRTLSYSPYTLVSSSMFGFHVPAVTSVTSTNLSWSAAAKDMGFQVYAVKKPSEYAEVITPEDLVKDAYFVVKDRRNNTYLTTSVFQNVYDNSRWNFALSVKNNKWPYAEKVNGTTIDTNVNTKNYVLEFYGVNYDTDIKRNYFYETASLTYETGSQTLVSAKRLYMGANRTDFTGTIVNYSDIKGTSLRYWNNYVPTGTIDLHGRDADSFGLLNPYRNAYTEYQSGSVPGVYVPNIQTLALDWNFANITASTSTGRFIVQDFSSGSVGSDYPSQYQGTTYSNLNLRQHTGRADFFTSGTNPVGKQYVYSGKTQLPEYVFTSDMVSVRDTDVEIFQPNSYPTNYYFAVEKSMYQSISRRMLQLFASVEDFNNLIGEPQSRYRYFYKDMEKLREIFFRKVGQVPDFEKYIKFYKWIDNAMGEILVQLFPASSKHSDGTETLVENHILERPKYKWTFIGDRKKVDDPFIPQRLKQRKNPSVCRNVPGWKYNHAPIPLVQDENCFWWKTRAERTNSIISGAINSRSELPSGTYDTSFEFQTVCIDAKLEPPYVGGINQSLGKRRNLRDIQFKDFESLEDCKDPLHPNSKSKIPFTAVRLIDSSSYKGDLVLPFTAISSTVQQGYNKALQGAGITNVDLANLHEDSVYEFRQSVPMQGPFTQEHVGGFIARHVPALRTNIEERPVDFHMVLGSAGNGTLYAITGNHAQGKYLRGAGPKSPLNITNIRTHTSATMVNGGVSILGNFTRNYEVVQGVDRSKTNMDFVFNNSSFFTGGIASAFIVPPLQTSSSASVPGSIDFAAPRQIATRRKNKTIISDRFSAPGSKYDSKQQYRDIPSDQFSPNNALPFRNNRVRRVGTQANRLLGYSLGAGAGLTGFLKLYTGWGGFQQSIRTELEKQGGNALSHFNEGGTSVTASAIVPDSASISNISYRGLAALQKTQRNTTERMVYNSQDDGFSTGTVRDNALIQRPVPAADRTQWFMSLSGSDTTGLLNYDAWSMSGSRYPANLFTTSSLAVWGSLLTQASGTYYDLVEYGAAGGTPSANHQKFIWARDYNKFGFVPWTQTRAAYKTQARYQMKNNIYTVSPTPTTTDVSGAGRDIYQLTETKKFIQTAAGLSSDVFTGLPVSNNYLYRFREPPVTSKYFPIHHDIKTYEGTPSKTNKDNRITAHLEYAYGNQLQAWANKTLNTRNRQPYARGDKYISGFAKRPYEIIRDNIYEGVSKDTSGIDCVVGMMYAETIHPKEKYTYLSGTRARLRFSTQDMWKNDGNVSGTNILHWSASSPNPITMLRSKVSQSVYNRQYPRIVAAFTTSQGYPLVGTDNVPWNPDSAAALAAIVTGPGSASMWPLDSYLYAESSHSLALISASTVGFTGRVLWADAGTMACGELMMTNYGTVMDRSDTTYTSKDAVYITSSILSAQYVYSVPVQASASRIYAEPLSPGSVLTRPPWSAARERKQVEGNRPSLDLSPQFPAYQTYEEYAKDVRVAGQEYSILPEFRISELLSDYSANGNVLSLVQKSLSLTGNTLNYDDSSDAGFFERYAISDPMYYLKQFMEPNSPDVQVNKNPKHFGMESRAVLKLLPYDGFYPQNRSLQIATLFSQSYGPGAAYDGAAKSSGSAFRTLLRPFFAPGILYNSIKAGIGVEYPISRETRNIGQFLPHNYDQPLAGGLSGSLTGLGGGGNIPGNRRRRYQGGESNFDFSDANVDAFFYADTIPFEGIMQPLEYLSAEENLMVYSTDVNFLLHQDVSASVKTAEDTFYRLAISNFLAAVPEFFLSEKPEGGHMTKFVAEIPRQGAVDNPAGSLPASDTDSRTVYVNAETAYIMEVGIKKTENFNMYSNPYAFGPPTATGSLDWASLPSVAKAATTSTVGALPSSSIWPNHLAEFAPFTPTYYYGDSYARLTYLPEKSGDVTLPEILNSGRIYVEYDNYNGYFYDWSSGSFTDINGNTVSTTDQPAYGWNRAWQNRQDLDASVVIDNQFSLMAGKAPVSPFDENKWVIMPKWECPILDFPRRGGSGGEEKYSFSSSVAVGGYGVETAGMWHQYGVMPKTNQGVYLYIADLVDAKGSPSYQLRLVGDPSPGAPGSATGLIKLTSRIPQVATTRDRYESLASLVGFNEDEIMPSTAWVPERAKRLGEIAPDGEKTMSEAVVAMPFYYNSKTQQYVAMTLTANPSMLGPQIKHFRRAFTNYSLPPALRKSLEGLIPPDYPYISPYIDPFGEDDYENVLAGTDMAKVPVVYLFEHKVALKRQDLADIWQGILPDIGTTLQKSVASISHYMPCDNIQGENNVIFPEYLQKQLELGIENPDGRPRVDLLDVAPWPDPNGFQTQIKWLVFKVKQRSQENYSNLIIEEINGGPRGRSWAYKNGEISDNIPNAEKLALLAQKDAYSKALYGTTVLGQERNTFNWPYDYCSLIELDKLTNKVGFRPCLEGELADLEKQRSAAETTTNQGFRFNTNVSQLTNAADRLSSGPSPNTSFIFSPGSN